MKESSGRSLDLPVSMAGHQDAPEQSGGEGGKEGGDWDERSICGTTATARGLMDVKHVIIERLNLTIRQGSAYLCRRTICHARWKQRLEGHLELLRCPLQFRQATSCAEIRAGTADTGHAGWIDGKAADVTGDLPFGNSFHAICDFVLVLVYSATSCSVDDAMPRAA